MKKSLTLKRVGDFFNGEYKISIWRAPEQITVILIMEVPGKF